MIKVILADDHHLVRQGIRSLLEKAEDIEVIAEAENGLEAVKLAERYQPQVLVMDIGMPRLNGVQAAEQIRNLDLPTKVVILSMHSDEMVVRQAIRSGAWGYLLKDSVATELLLAIRAAQRGEVYLSPAVSKMVMTNFINGRTNVEAFSGFDSLSLREREVLKLIAEGYTNKAIADTLFITIKTVEKHRASVMAKLNLQDMAGLVRVAIKHGLIFLDD
jgi:DNA-binding NarL/FixJ family response regulator